MTTFAEDIAAECITLERKAGGTLVYKFSAHRAALKRASGGTLNEANLFWLFYLLTKHRRGMTGQTHSQNGNSEDENRLFLIATLLAFDTRMLESYAKHQRLPISEENFGAALDALEKMLHPSEWEAKRKIQPDTKRRTSPVERRFLLLLDTHMEPDGTGDLPFRLRQIVKYMLDKSKSITNSSTSINWDSLLWDLRSWDSLDKTTQKKWARGFYGYQRPAEVQSEAIQSADSDDDHINLDED